jgi:hypothetical protein
VSILLIALAIALALLCQSLLGGSLVPTSGSTTSATVAPQGTGTSTISPQTTTLTSSPTITQLLFGTSTNQVNLIVTQDRQLAISTNEVLDLYGSTTPLLDMGGVACLFRHIKFIEIYLLPGQGDISGLTIGGASSDPWLAGGALGGTAPTTTIYPGGPSWRIGEPTVGFAVTALAGQLKVLNNSGAAVQASSRTAQDGKDGVLRLTDLSAAPTGISASALAATRSPGSRSGDWRK